MMNFEKKFIVPFLKYPLKCKFDGQTVTNCDFLEGRLLKYFFQEMCSSGGKQTIHKVSAAFIVKNYHPRTSLTKNRISFKCRKNISISRFCSNLGYFSKVEKISDSENVNKLYIILKHVIWGFRIYNLFREIEWTP